MIKHRYATSEDIIKFYGKVPHTMRAMALIKDDEVLGIGGVAYDEDQIKLFMDIKEEAKNYPVALMKASYDFMDFVKDNYSVLYAVVGNNETAPRYLERLGLKEYLEGIYVWHS